MRRRFALPVTFVLASALAACGVAKSAGHGSRAAAAVAAPRLVVVVAVDGLSWSRLESWRPWFTAGLKRLLDEGAVATECRYGHLNTETGPGHASIATGAPPRVHGIALNQWYAPSADGTKMETVYCADNPRAAGADPASKTVLGPGHLEIPTLGDRLVAKDARAKVVALSIKDRSAILMAGHDPRLAAYWYAEKTATFTTSASYDAATTTGAAVARVVTQFNAVKAGANVAERYGTIVDRLPVPKPPPKPGYESGLEAYQDAIAGNGFPKDLSKARKPLATVLLWTSISDRLLTDLALDLLADESLGLGRDEVPDVLWISFSANDYVAHYYGPESVESLEVLRGLDVQLGRLLDDLTRRFGRDAVDVALSADHGMLPIPEGARRADPKSASFRVTDTTIAKRLNAAVDAVLGLDPARSPVYRLEGCSLWLDRSFVGKTGGPDAASVLSIVRRELATTWKDAVERTIVLDPPFSEPHGDPTLLRAWNALVPGRSGDLFVVSRPGVLVDPYAGKGTSHGTPWDYDTHVPLIYWGGGITARRIGEPVTPYDLAPTVAAWLGVDLPDAAGTRMNVRGARARQAR